MASLGLSHEPNYADFFSEGAVINLRYWQQHPAVQRMDIAGLDHHLAGLLRAITFAGQLEAAWPLLLDLCRSLASFMERRGYWDSWEHVLSQALTLAQRVQDQTGAVEISLLLARLYQRQSRFKDTILQYRHTIRLARRVEDTFNEARACSNLGFLYIEYNYWHRAEVLSCYALSLFKQLDNDHGRAHTHNHLGVLYIRRQRWSLAQHHLECAHKVWQKMNDDHGLIRVYINLSLLNIELECPQKILECSEKALVKAQLTKEEMELGTIYMNMGIAYRLMGLSTKTEQYIWQAEAVFRRFTNVIGLASVKDNLGLVYLDQKRWSEAHQWLTSALEAWRKLGSEIGEFRVLIYLIEYALARGERQKALAQLDVLEQRLNQDRKEAFHFLRERITNYRRSLTENLSP